MSTILELLLFLLSVTNGHVVIEHVDFVPSYYGHAEDGGARVDCSANREKGCTIRISTSAYDREAGEAYLKGQRSTAGRAYAEVLAHELAHVWDYMDDGRVNGSPGYRDYLFPDTTMGRYCGQNAAERYACAVIETLSLSDTETHSLTEVATKSLPTSEDQPVTVEAPVRVRPVFDLRPR